MSRAADFEAVRARIAAVQAGAAPTRAVMPFGDLRLDSVFPAGGLPLGCWHEVAGEGLEIETAAAAGAFVATLAGALTRPRSGQASGLKAGRGALVWVMRRGDLYAPGLSAFGLSADRLIQVQVRNEAEALAALEDALGCAGVAVAIGEIGGEAGPDLTAGRRLQLACERGGGAGFVIRRRPFGGRTAKAPASGAPGGSAAATRWSIAPSPSGSASGGAGGGARDDLGVGAPRWRATLHRCRGGRPGAWILEMNHGAHPLRVVAQLADRQLETSQPEVWRRAV
jgi:protein ImuA